MNVGGAVSLVILGITALTVFGALVAYGVFKARQRVRRPGARSRPGEIELEYFVEYTLPEDGEKLAPVHTARLEAKSTTGLWALLATTALVAVGGVGLAIYAFNRDAAVRPAKALASADRSDGGKKSARGDGGHQSGRTVEPVDRGEAPQLAPLASRAPSYFVAPRFDRNGDGRVQPRERLMIHAEVPQFVVVSSDDNGTVEGLKWMRDLFRKHGVLGKATFFCTANYLRGRPNYLGGPVDSWWQRLAYGSYVGLHGTTHARGAERWSSARWAKEHSTIQQQIVKRLEPPPHWRWSSYPWGTRAPFLMFTDAYFEGLRRLRHPVLFDASLVVQPGGPHKRKPKPGERRVLSWPFTLDHPLPKDADRPYLPDVRRRAKIGRHKLWEVPVYAWYLRAAGPRGGWQPSLDYALWQAHPCHGDGINQRAVDDVIANLLAHYRGNRAPFMIGLHAQEYGAGKRCRRRTMARIFARIRELTEEGRHIRYISAPDLILWIQRASRRG